jgi:hypothetical protein
MSCCLLFTIVIVGDLPGGTSSTVRTRHYLSQASSTTVEWIDDSPAAGSRARSQKAVESRSDFGLQTPDIQLGEWYSLYVRCVKPVPAGRASSTHVTITVSLLRRTGTNL